MGKEARPKGAQTCSDRFRAFQGYEIEEAGTIRGPEIPGQGQGSREIRDLYGTGSVIMKCIGLLGSFAYSEALYATSKKAGVKCI